METFVKVALGIVFAVVIGTLAWGMFKKVMAGKKPPTVFRGSPGGGGDEDEDRKVR